MEAIGKDNAVARQRTKPEIVTVGNRRMISSGRWNNDLMAQEVVDRGSLKYLTVGEMAKLAYGQNTPRSKAQVRRNLSHLFRSVLKNHGELLVYERGGPHGRTTAVKVAEIASELDRQNLHKKLRFLHLRKELTDETFALAQQVLNEKLKGIAA